MHNSQYIQFVLYICLVIIVIAYYFLTSRHEKDENFSGNAKIAVIDAELLKSSAICFKSHEKVADMLNEVIDKMKASETEIKLEYEKVKSNIKMNEQQKQAQIVKIENKWSDISNQYNVEIQKIRSLDYKLSERLGKELNKVIQEISKKHGLNLVINKEIKDTSVVFYNSKNIDITEKVIANLNKIIPTSYVKDILK